MNYAARRTPVLPTALKTIKRPARWRLSPAVALDRAASTVLPTGCELILGGQKSGKSRRAEMLAAAWLAAAPTHRATLIATAQPLDDEMRQRIARHQADRAERVPQLATLEEPLALADAIRRHSAPKHLLLVDCLTLWLTNWLMPLAAAPQAAPSLALANPLNLSEKTQLAPASAAPIAMLLEAIREAPGPLLLVGNEIGLGLIPLGPELRAFVDTLGLLNQQVAALAQRVVLMAAGQPLLLKNQAKEQP